jgi:hypothetical protein
VQDQRLLFLGAGPELILREGDPAARSHDRQPLLIRRLGREVLRQLLDPQAGEAQPGGEERTEILIDKNVGLGGAFEEDGGFNLVGLDSVVLRDDLG